MGRLPKVARPRNLGLNDSIPLGLVAVRQGGRLQRPGQRQFRMDERGKGRLQSRSEVVLLMLFDQEEEFSVWY